MLTKLLTSCAGNNNVGERMLQLHETVDAPYESTSMPIIEKQLALAGQRLAAVLKAARGSVRTKADAAPVAPSLEERAARRRPVRRWRPQWNRVGIGAGLAAAAALIAIFAVVGLGSHSPTGGPAANSAQGAPSVIQRGASYSPALLQSLADQLRAPAQRKQVVSRPPALGPAEGAASPGPFRAAARYGCWGFRRSGACVHGG